VLRFIFIVLILVGFSGVSWAKKVPSKYYNLPKVVAVQNRPYYLNKDLTLQLGTLPSDAFNKGFTAGLSYTHFFSDYFAWEVINTNYNFNVKTDLRGDVEKLGPVVVKNNGFEGLLDYIVAYATTNLVYTPLYTKSLLFNKTVIQKQDKTWWRDLSSILENRCSIQLS